MRKFLKEEILVIFKTIYEAHKIIKNFIKEENLVNAKSVIGNCQETVLHIGKIIENSESKNSDESLTKVFDSLNEYCKYTYDIYMNISDMSNGKEIRDNLDKKLYKFEKSVKEDIKVKLEIVFLPYKAAMWDSFESIWKSAIEDTDCDVYVIPIPYYDRNPDHSFGKFHYEGNEYPDYVPITYYNAYNFAARKPDVIYIHNPYDNCNYVTSIEPRFYSKELKKYTDCLVYSPYGIPGYYKNPSEYFVAHTPGIINADFVIVQSEVLKKIYIDNNTDSKKLLLTGSPKIDKIVNRNITDFPQSWEFLKDRKVCLLNASITSFLEWDNFIDVLKNIMIALLEENKYSILWRPHPLLDSTIKSMRPDKKQKFDDFCNWFANQKYCIRDECSEPIYAIDFSDILISDYSSVMYLYLPTEKPIIQIFNGALPFDDTSLFACDTRNVYYYNFAFESSKQLVELTDKILKDDYLKDKRLSAYKQSMVNCDGTCGKKIHEFIIKKILNK